MASLRTRIPRPTAAKLALRLLLLTTALIALGTAAAAFRYAPHLIWLTAPPAASALWSLAALALLPFRAPHPALPLALDLALVPALAATAALAAAGAAVFAGGLAADRAFHACAVALVGTDDSDEAACEALLAQVAALALAAAVCAALAAAGHAVGGVAAGRELHAWRRARGERRTRARAVEMVRRGEVTGAGEDAGEGEGKV